MRDEVHQTLIFSDFHYVPTVHYITAISPSAECEQQLMQHYEMLEKEKKNRVTTYYDKLKGKPTQIEFNLLRKKNQLWSRGSWNATLSKND